MKSLYITIIFTISLQACNLKQPSQESGSNGSESFRSELVNGKYTTDFNSAQELKGLRNTVENFTLLNKKKLENDAAYREFGELLMMHIDRINTYCVLEGEGKEILHQHLEKLAQEAQKLKADKSTDYRLALQQVNSILSNIDSTFNYMN